MEQLELAGDRRICGVIGNPLGHTLSPAMHNSAFEHLGLDYIYLTFEVSKSHLKDTLLKLKTENFRGLNITHPFKLEIMPYLDTIDETAQQIGAVNTVVNDGDYLVGYNTDSYGALEALRNSGIELEKHKRKIMILGAGGAARAIALPLVKLGHQIIIANRTYHNADELANILNKITRANTIKAIKLDDIEKELNEAELLINCTPVGMKGYTSDCPIPSKLIRNDLIVFDIVYSPKNTPLITAAKVAKAKVIYGYEMFIHQGVKAFELWTGVEAPVEVMRKIILEKLDDS